MKKSIYFISSIFALCVIALSSHTALAANFPALTLSSTGSAVQIIVSNADINAPVIFYYPSGSSNTSVNIGTTNSSGYLAVTINPGTYTLSNGAPVYISVDGEQTPTATWPSVAASGSSQTIFLTQTALTIATGQSSTITASNITGTLSLSGNNNPSVATVSVNGNSIVVNGVNNGTAVLTFCDSGDGSCATVNVTVQPSYLGSSPLSLSPNNLTVGTGQNQTVLISGYASGPYYVSSNTGTSAVSTSVSGTSLIITGLSVGSANISVCTTGNQCGTTFVNVISNGTSAVPTNTPLALSSFSIASGNQNNYFLVGGNTITINWSANQPVTNAIVRVNGNNVLVNGSGSGPYTASYSVTGSESSPLPIVISFSNTAGSSATEYFWTSNTGGSPATTIANPVTTPVTTTPVAVPNCPAGMTCTPNPTATVSTAVPVTTAAAPASGYSFDNYLYIGMTPQGSSDPDVTALQQRLSNDGLYSGPVTGYFGPLTQAAVEAYQARHNLDQLGVVGPATRALLNQGI